jgi:hypothetical protein
MSTMDDYIKTLMEEHHRKLEADIHNLRKKLLEDEGIEAALSDIVIIRGPAPLDYTLEYRPKPKPCRDVEQCLAADEVWLLTDGRVFTRTRGIGWTPGEKTSIVTLAPLGDVYLEDPTGE